VVLPVDLVTGCTGSTIAGIGRKPQSPDETHRRYAYSVVTDRGEAAFGHWGTDRSARTGEATRRLADPARPEGCARRGAGPGTAACPHGGRTDSRRGHKLLHAPATIAHMDRQQVVALLFVIFMILSSVAYAFAVF
jgi:hypothetical protein